MVSISNLNGSNLNESTNVNMFLKLCILLTFLGVYYSKILHFKSKIKFHRKIYFIYY